jgi:fatty-acyl-CoA synthase
MMDSQLLISSILRHADLHYPDREIVSVTADNPQHRYTYADCFGRTRQLANALGKLGLSHGDRVATLAWNDYRHLECYYAISGAGYVCHTINPRLFPEQIVFMINHAEDKWIFTDPMFVPLLEKIAAQAPGVEGYVVMTDDKNMPETSPMKAATMNGRNSTKILLRRFAIPREPQVIRKVCCTVIARPSCMPGLQ